MALINCPECGRDVSDTCKCCIHCGFRLAAKTGRAKPEAGDRLIQGKRGAVALGVILGLSMLLLIGTVALSGRENTTGLTQEELEEIDSLEWNKGLAKYYLEDEETREAALECYKSIKRQYLIAKKQGREDKPLKKTAAMKKFEKAWENYIKDNEDWREWLRLREEYKKYMGLPDDLEKAYESGNIKYTDRGDEMLVYKGIRGLLNIALGKGMGEYYLPGEFTEIEERLEITEIYEIKPSYK